MVGHAELLAPLGFPASASVKVAALRAHDAHVALGQLGHARVAVALAETGLGLASAMDAVDRAQVFQAHRGADQRIDRDLGFAQTKCVLHVRPVQARRHFADCTAANLDQWMASDLNRILGT
ncbi:hypothetical protein D3C84_939560 [compost metagenome]